jgi:hypothetical protein
MSIYPMAGRNPNIKATDKYSEVYGRKRKPCLRKTLKNPRYINGTNGSYRNRTRNKCVLHMIIQYRIDWKGHTMKLGGTC